MTSVAYITQYWDAEKGHKNFIYPKHEPVKLAFGVWVEGQIMPWLTPSNMYCLRLDNNKLIFIDKQDVAQTN